eukprot:766733-Hanusia_phi.AAC.1
MISLTFLWYKKKNVFVPGPCGVDGHALMARLKRKAAEIADKKRRLDDDRDKQIQLKEKTGNIPFDVQVPHCFWSNFDFQELENAPKYHVNVWNVDITLKPLLGVAFLDLNRTERFGIIKRVRPDSVEVFILYNKSTITEKF